MKASLYARMQYVTPQNLPGGWPVAPALYDSKIGMQCFEDAMEKLEFAEHLGFDWISFSEHHYSYNSVAPHPAVMAARMVDRLKRAKLAILAHVLPLNNPVRVAEELALLDCLSGGRVVVGFLRGTVNEDQTFSVNPTETRARSLESMELILKALTEPQPFGWEGRFYQFRTVAVWPRPLQQPLPPTYVLTRSPESAEFAASHHLGLGVSFAPLKATAGVMRQYRKMCTEHGWEPASDDLIFRATIMVAETDEAAQEGVRRYWSARGLANSTAAARAVTELAGRLRGSSMANSQTQTAGGTAGSPAAPGVQMNFVGSPDTVFRQIKEYHDECGVGIVDLFFQGPTMEHEAVMKSLELFGKEVLPRMHEL
jgi:alkanesulfonate monooxygenase SsuD/methylene tetrahydromethanopterin reductase-like flavin-dependent oxidoreductase (luciferase family)